MTLPYIMGANFVTVMVEGVTHTIGEDQPNYKALREAIRTKNFDAVPELVTPAKAIETFGAGEITVRDNEVYYNGAVLRNGVTARIIQMMSEGFDAQPLMLFLGKLMSNPSKTAVDELYDWLEGTRLPITEDGDFIAYKKVRDDYRDFYTGKVLNKPAELMTDKDLASLAEPMNGVSVSVVDGETVLAMPRNQVDDNRNRTCSQGLHFCSLSYLPNYYGGSGRVLLVKINPADVVSIPSDYNFAKGRAWTYRIVGEHTAGETTEAFETPVVTNKGVPVRDNAAEHKQRMAEAMERMVLGVDFGSKARGDMVRELVNRCNTQAGGGRTLEQARVDGFDDAWNNVLPTLYRFGGSNMRDAVSYAQAYFEGYDRCRGKAPADTINAVAQDYSEADDFDWDTDEERDEIVRVLAAPRPHHTYKHGYDNGYWDGQEDGSADQRNGTQFTLDAAIQGGKNYRRGYIQGYLNNYK